MPVRRLFLRFPDGPDSCILRSTYRTLNTVVDLVEAPLMKGVLAKKMNRGEIQVTTAC